MSDASPVNKPDRSYVPWYRRCVPSWRTVAIVVVLLLAAPFAVRWYRLSRMPDVPVPFDVVEFSVPPRNEDNAFFYFQQAVQLHRGFKDTAAYGRLFDDGVKLAWSDVPEDLRTWMIDEQPALELFRRAGRCPTATFIPADRYTPTTLLPIQQTVRDFFRLTSLDVLRLLDEGNTREAVEVLHDAFRASRHLGRRGCLTERYVGAACHRMLMPRWQEWARHRNVTAEELEAALTRLREDWTLTPPLSDNLKVECLMNLQSTHLPMTYLRDEFDDAIDRFMTQRFRVSAKPTLGRLNAVVPGWEIPVLWVLGEPELISRASRLWLTHELKTCDFPVAEQPPRVPGFFQLCDTPERTGGLTATQLNQRLESSLLRPFYHMRPSLFDPMRADAGRQALLETELMLQIRMRQSNATSRADFESWLADFPWPVDLCSAEAKPIQYQAGEAGLKLWSVGADGLDQGGQDDGSFISLDIVVTIPWPGGGGTREGEKEGVSEN